METVPENEIFGMFCFNHTFCFELFYFLFFIHKFFSILLDETQSLCLPKDIEV